MQLRDYQASVYAETTDAWREGHKHLLVVMPTGAGKTVFFGHAISQYPGASVAIAHRRELVTQMSMALARYGLRHRVIGPKDVVKQCVALHTAELGRAFYDPNARIAAAGVDSLLNLPANDPWLQQVGLVVQDEAHHVLRENKWGRASRMFPNASTLGVTATPLRADNKGLGSNSDGIFEHMIVGPSMRDLINRGFLSDYRLLVPPTHQIDLTDVNLSDATGDYNAVKLRKAVHKAKITGDVVRHYLAFARGKLGVTFAVDVEAATELAQAYRDAGVRAEVVSADTDPLLRANIVRRFRNREIEQLVNVDLFGEGFDLPAIEVVSMARPTQSYGLYCQQFGRALRPLEGKDRAIILDHVGNVERHKLPDKPRSWSLEPRDRKRTSGDGGEAIRICPGCTSAFERFRSVCPFCGWEVVPAGRATMEQTEGVLVELDPEVLAQMRGEVLQADAGPNYPWGADPLTVKRLDNVWFERNKSQIQLRETMTVWGGWQTHQGLTDEEAQRRFFHRYGIDVLSAWLLKKRDADVLQERLAAELTAANITGAMT